MIQNARAGIGIGRDHYGHDSSGSYERETRLRNIDGAKIRIGGSKGSYMDMDQGLNRKLR